MTEQEPSHFLSIANLIATKYGMTIEIGDKIFNPATGCYNTTINFIGDYDSATEIACAEEIANVLEKYAA